MSWFLSFVFLGDVVLQINCSSLLPWQLLLGTFWKRLKVRWSYLVKAKPEAWKIPKQRLRNAIWYDVLKNFFFLPSFVCSKYGYITCCYVKKMVSQLSLSEISTSGLCRLCGPHGATCGTDGAFSGLSSRTQPLICAALASILSRSESNMRWPGVWWNNNMKKQHYHPSDLDNFKPTFKTQNDRRSEPCCLLLQLLLLQFAMVQAVWCFQSQGFVERLPPGHTPDIVVAYSIANVTFRILSEYASFDNWQVWQVHLQTCTGSTYHYIKLYPSSECLCVSSCLSFRLCT